MFCNFCGHKLNTKAIFCPKCGKKIENSTAVPGTFKDNKLTESFKNKIETQGEYAGVIKEPIVTPKENIAKNSYDLSQSRIVHKPVNNFDMSKKENILSKIGKRQIVSFAFWTLFFILCMAICSVFIYAIFYEKSVVITSLYDESVSKSTSFSTILGYMYDGHENYPPTVASTLLAFSVYVLFYSLPALFIITFVGTIFGNSKMTWHTTFSIVSIISAIELVLIMPLVLAFVPHIKNIFGMEYSILINDIGTITYTPLFIFATVIMLLVIISYVILFLIIRREKDEKISESIK